MKNVCLALTICLIVAGLICPGYASSPTAQTDAARPIALDVGQINKAAIDAHSLFLDTAARIHAVDTLWRLVRVKGPSGQEELIRQEVQRMLTHVGATVVPTKSDDGEAPYNLVMEISGSGDLASKRAILLNAHLDTIARSTPEFLAFDDNTGDFFHVHEADSEKSSSFGGDDRAAVAVIVETVRLLQENYWSRGIPHRRILLVFTADEERGCVGARYLCEHDPDLFAELEITLSIDGPLDYKSGYPRDSFVAVAAESDSTIAPYKHVIELMEEFCRRTAAQFGKTETGLGMGDFARFPSSARAGLHLRSVVRGFHRRERVNVRDLISQIDLLCYLLLNWDHSLALQEAAAGGDIGMVKSLIEKGTEVDQREEALFRTPLHRAVVAGNREVAELLLSYGANPNARDSSAFSALHHATINGHKEIAELLIARGADVNAKDASGNTPLYNAVRSGHSDIAQMLLEKGAELSVHAAAYLGHIQDVEDFVETGTSIDVGDSRGFTPLNYAVSKGQYDVVEFLIAKGANVNVKDIWPFGTPLHCAVENGHKEIVELLAAADADVNASKRRPAGDAPLHSAVKGGHDDIVVILESHGADLNVKDNSGQTPLDIAISRNRKDIVKLLLARGAEVPSIHTAARTGILETVKAFLEKGANPDEKDSSGLTPLHIAVLGDNKELVELLIDKGANVNAKDKRGYTPLYYSAQNGHEGIVEMLLAKNADVNARSGYLRQTAAETALRANHNKVVELLIAKGADVTPLHFAVHMKDLAKARSLIDSGVDVNKPTLYGTTPLHIAAKHGAMNIARLLVDHGANVNAKDNWDWTVLHNAVFHSKEMVELLIAKGANINARNGGGRTPIRYAKDQGYTEIVELLRKHGAKE